MSKKVKILFTPSDNNSTSGAFLSMIKLCNILQTKYNYEILVLLHCNGTGEKVLQENNIKYKKINSFNWFVPYKPKTFKRKMKKALCYLWMPITRLYNNIAIYKIKKLIKEEKIDIVHINTSCCYVPAIAALKCNVPYVWHIREFLEEDQERCIWNKKYGYKLISKANAVITISGTLFNKYKTIMPEANLMKIYNGIDEKVFLNINHRIFNDSIIKMLMVGSINEGKGQWQAIQACKELFEEGIKNFSLYIIGKKSEYAINLEKKVNEFNLDENIKFLGTKNNIGEYYAKSDITFMCSKSEAFGRVTVEAMMAGSLVIGANTAATSELIDDNKTGLLYEYGNIEDLKNKIKFALNNIIKMQQIADLGRTKMLNLMTADKNAECIDKLYKKIINM